MPLSSGRQAVPRAGKKLQQYFRVRVGAENAAVVLQLRPQERVIVDLAVVDQEKTSVSAAHGLVRGGRKIKDGKTIMSQDNAAVLKGFPVVRPPVPQTRHHCRNRVKIARCCALRPENAANAAHNCSLVKGRR